SFSGLKTPRATRRDIRDGKFYHNARILTTEGRAGKRSLGFTTEGTESTEDCLDYQCSSEANVVYFLLTAAGRSGAAGAATKNGRLRVLLDFSARFDVLGSGRLCD